MESQPKHYITPTLQANWNLAISDIIRCLNADLVYEAWLATQTLYDLLPPKIHKKLENSYEKTQKELSSCGPQGVGYEDMVLGFNESRATYKRHIRPFFREMYAELFDGKYLDNPGGPATKVGGLHRIEQTLG